MSFQIDEHFARFGATKFAIDKITSFGVSSRTEPVQAQGNRKSLLTIAGIAIVFCLIAVPAEFVGGQWLGGVEAAGGLAAGVALGWFAYQMPPDPPSRREIFRLNITTNAGEKAVFETASLDEMRKVESALEQAMLKARR